MTHAHAQHEAQNTTVSPDDGSFAEMLAMKNAYASSLSCTERQPAERCGEQKRGMETQYKSQWNQQRSIFEVLAINGHPMKGTREIYCTTSGSSNNARARIIRAAASKHIMMRAGVRRFNAVFECGIPMRHNVALSGTCTIIHGYDGTIPDLQWLLNI